MADLAATGRVAHERPTASSSEVPATVVTPTEPAATAVASTEAPAAEETTPAGGSGPTLERAVGFLLVALGFLIGSRAISDNSFLTHLATGGVVLDTGRVPTADVFSFTAEGSPWTVQSWFASVVYRVSADLGGLEVVRLVNGVLAAALTASLWRLSRPARTLLPRVALLGAAITVGAVMWSPRPLLFGLLAFALAIELIEHPTRSHRWLVPVLWVWVNTHGSFPLFFVFLGARMVGRYAEDRRLDARDLSAFQWGAIGTAVGALNPLGPKLLVFPFALLGNSEALEDVVEWMPPDFERPSEWAFVFLAFLMVVAARNGARWSRLFPAFGFFVTGLLAVRNINPAAVVLVAGVAPALAAVPGSLTGAVRSIASRGTAVLAGALLALVAVTAVLTPPLDLETYPVEEVDWLEERGLVATDDVRILHKDTVGNYLEYRYGTDANVFVDDRYDMYPLDVLDDHATLFFGGDIQAVIDRYDADVVLWANEGPLADWLREPDNGWRIATESETYLVALPSD